MKTLIIGSGISGIMAAQYFYHYQPLVLEKEKQLSFLNNNYASIRVKNERIGDLLNTRLKEVEITKQIYHNKQLLDKAPIDAKNLYSFKVAGKLDKRSIDFDSSDNKRFFFDEKINYKKNFECKTNYNLIGVDKNNLIFETKIKDSFVKVPINYDICISTIPLPVLLNIVGYKGLDLCDFKMLPIFVISLTLDIKSTVYQTIYFPQHSMKCYRANLEKNELLIESLCIPDDSEVNFILNVFGLSGVKILSNKLNTQKSGKISSIDDIKRKKAILHLTENYNIYSLGRYAIWKNGLEMDDVYKDLNKIEKLIEIDNNKERKYEGRLN